MDKALVELAEQEKMPVEELLVDIVPRTWRNERQARC